MTRPSLRVALWSLVVLCGCWPAGICVALEQREQGDAASPEPSTESTPSSPAEQAPAEGSSTEITPAQQSALAEAIAAVTKQLAEVSVYEADISSRFLDRAGEERLVTEEHLLGQRPRSLHITSHTVKGTIPDATLITDGSTLWMYQPSLKLVEILDLTGHPDFYPFSMRPEYYLAEPLRHVVRDTLRLAGTDTTDGVETYVLEGRKASGRATERAIHIKLWIGKQDGFLRRVKESDRSTGLLFREAVIRQIRTDVPLKRDAFTFSAPDGVKVTHLMDGR